MSPEFIEMWLRLAAHKSNVFLVHVAGYHSAGMVLQESIWPTEELAVQRVNALRSHFGAGSATAWYSIIPMGGLITVPLLDELASAT